LNNNGLRYFSHVCSMIPSRISIFYGDFVEKSDRYFQHKLALKYLG